MQDGGGGTTPPPVGCEKKIARILAAVDLERRLIDFHESLEGLKGPASMQTAKIFNALLEETKKARPDDPIVAVIEPA